MPISRRYSIYALKNLKDYQNYIGLSANVESRLKMHNAGKVRSTKSRRPFQLIYQEHIGSLSEARMREKYFKSAAGGKYLEKRITEIAK